MTGRCDLTDLYVDQCAHCRRIVAETDYVERIDPVVMGPWFAAEFPGDCDGCGDDFDAGDQIRANGEGGWVAECCGEDDRG